MKKGYERWHGTLKAYQGPVLRVWEIQVDGPHIEEWPPVGHDTLYGNLSPESLSWEVIEDRLFVCQTCLPSTSVGGTQTHPRYGARQAPGGFGSPECFAVRISNHPFRSRISLLKRRGGRVRDEYALASRLSYFLWSSMPDNELLESAEQGKSEGSAVLTKQVERMLADPKSKRFSNNFLRVWLELDNIGKMPPSKEFVSFYRDNLESAMRKETEVAFEHVLQNFSPIELLNADYSFINRELAAHYGMPGLQGNEFRKVSLSGTERGGLLGHGSFLTASANGVDTSPVIRGIYVMNKLLDYTPPPPPMTCRRSSPAPPAPPLFGKSWSGTGRTPPAPSVTIKSIPLALPWRTTIPSEHGD